MIRILIVLISLVLVSNAYAADKKSQSAGNNAPLLQPAPDPDDLSKKAQQEATQKSNYMNSKYKQHSKKDNPNQTAAQTQAKHGGPTASNVSLPSQNSGYTAPTKTKSSNKKKN